jgi:acylphosphatase
MAPVRTARRYLVSGRVQGVGYRMFALDAGRREGLHGHVRNLADGRVEVEAEGEAEALGRFEAALWRGPSHARVDDILIDDVAPTGRAPSFTIA